MKVARGGWWFLVLAVGVGADEIQVFGDGYRIEQALTTTEAREHLARTDVHNRGRVVLPDDAIVELDADGVPRVHARPPRDTTVLTVERGTFQANLARLADDLGYPDLAWDGRVHNCPIAQDTGYTVSGRDPRDALTYYAATHDFQLLFNEVERSIEVRFAGGRDALLPCKQGQLTTAPLPDRGPGSWAVGEAVISFERAAPLRR